jgi:hypothetical protein
MDSERTTPMTSVSYPERGLSDCVVLESFLIAPVAAKRASTIP